MTDRYKDIKNRLVRLAEQDENIRAVIAIGSSVRSAVPADEFSDLDLIIASRDTEKWFSGEYPNRLGEVSISFIEPTLGGGRERRCIYDDDKDVDMIIFTPQQLESAFKDGVAQWVMDRGYVFLYDADSFAELAKANSDDNADAGGLYEEVYKGQMVKEFEDWCFDPARKPGDTGVVKTTYGYHIMYFVGEGESYRRHQILHELKDAAYDEWAEQIVEGKDAVLDEAGTKYLRTDLVLGSGESTGQ
jgi:predicted nucleotidyltransferase